jgi:hypothetical protein
MCKWIAFLIPFQMVGQSMCDCVTNADVYADVLFADTYTEMQTYTDTGVLMDIIGNWGTISPNIYDLDGSGSVDSGDLLLALGGFGIESLTDICDFVITGTWSSAWQCDYPDTQICFLHISVTDESDLDWDACPLNTFWTERLTPEGILREYWHKD